MKEVKYSPFGDTESRYKPQVSNIQSTQGVSKTQWFVATLVVFLLIMVSIFAANAVTVRNTYNDAENSLNAFNDSSVAVHHTIISTNAQQQYADMAKNAKEDKQKDAFTATSSIMRRLPDHPPAIYKESSSEQSAVEVAPYFAICDLVAKYPPENGGELSVACSDYTSIAQDMMGKVRTSNTMTSGPLGMFAFKTDSLPDIMK